jgi:hypothetical protein
MTSPDRPETPTSAADLLHRTRRRAQQLRRRRRVAWTAAAVAVVAVAAAAVAVPLALSGGSRPSHSVEVVSPPTTTGPVPSTTPSNSTPAGTVPPTSATTTTATSTSTSTSPPTTTPIATTVPALEPCATGRLQAALTHLGAAAGSSYYDLVLTNAGTVTCTTGGYPGVSYVTSSAGTMVGAAAQRNPSSPVVTLTLAPGQAARATLTETDSLNYPSSTCRLTSVAGLRVYPPNQTAALFVPQSTQAYANPADVVLQIAPLATSAPAG